MDELMDEVIGYEGTYVDDRGVIDTIKQIVSNIAYYLQNNDKEKMKFLMHDYTMFSCIKELAICGNCCYIKYNDEGYEQEVYFSSIFYDDNFRNKIFDYDKLISMGYCLEDAEFYNNKYIYSARCHDITLDYLTEHKDNQDIRAVTSLCINCENLLFYHSYIWDTKTNMIYDYARNICMNKELYDMLFVYKEINVLNYDKCCNYIKKYGSLNSKNFYALFFLGVKAMRDIVERVDKSKKNPVKRFVKRIFN